MTARCYLICTPIISCCICCLFLPIQIGHAEDFTTFGTISHPDGTGEGFPRIYELRNGSTFRLRGRIDTDALWSIQDTANINTFGNLKRYSRRARVGAQGYFGLDSRYIAEIDMNKKGRTT